MPINNSTSRGVFRWKPACWLRVSGSDAAAFLQGQFSQDLRAAGTAPVYGLWLTVKGKVLADSFVFRRDGSGGAEFWVGSYFSPAAVIRERLESYVIADDVVVEDVGADWTAVSFFGGAGETVAAPVGSESLFVFEGRRGRPARECIYRVSDGEPVSADPGLSELAEADLVRWRIEAGIPAIPADVGPADLPNEAGLEIDAISYTKGCYLGQEVMARLKAMGQVRRRLVRVRGEGLSVPAPGTALCFNGHAVGEVRSSVAQDDGWIGLAMITRLHVTAGSVLSAGAGVSVRLMDAP